MKAKINPLDVDTSIMCVHTPFYAWLLVAKHLSHRPVCDIRTYLRLGKRMMPTNMDGRCVNHYRAIHATFELILQNNTPEAIADKERMEVYNRVNAIPVKRKRRKKRVL